MLKNAFVLTKLYIKSSFEGTKEKMSSKSKWGFLLYGFLLLYLGGVSVFLSAELASMFLELDQGGWFVADVIVIAATFSVFITVFSCVNAMYFSKDNINLLPLPLSEAEMVIGKTNYLLFFNYIYLLFLTLIPLCVYGVLAKESVLFFLIAIVCFIFIPVIPTALVCYIVIVIMSFTKKVKHKNIFQYIGYFVALALSLGISFFSSSTSGLSQEELYQILLKTNGVVELIKKVLPVIALPLDALVEKKILNVIILAVLTAVLYVAYGHLSKGLYLKGLVGCLFSSDGKSNKKINEKAVYKNTGVFRAYFVKELKCLVRRPVYLIQCVLPAILLPFIMFFAMYAPLKSENGAEFEEIFELISSGLYDQYIFLGLLCFVLFISMMIFISTTAISRDGENAVFMKYIPLSFSTQVFYKAGIDTLFCFAAAVLTVGFSGYMLQIPLKILLTVLIALVPYSVSHGLVLILVDLSKPKLHWSTEMQVVKNNLNTMFGMVYSVFCGVLCIPFFIIDMNYLLIMAIMGTLYTVFSYIAYSIIVKKENVFADRIC